MLLRTWAVRKLVGTVGPMARQENQRRMHARYKTFVTNGRPQMNERQCLGGALQKIASLDDEMRNVQQFELILEKRCVTERKCGITSRSFMSLLGAQADFLCVGGGQASGRESRNVCATIACAREGVEPEEEDPLASDPKTKLREETEALHPVHGDGLNLGHLTTGAPEKPLWAVVDGEQIVFILRIPKGIVHLSGQLMERVCSTRNRRDGIESPETRPEKPITVKQSELGSRAEQHTARGKRRVLIRALNKWKTSSILRIELCQVATSTEMGVDKENGVSSDRELLPFNDPIHITGGSLSSKDICTIEPTSRWKTGVLARGAGFVTGEGRPWVPPFHWGTKY